jgi:hypothetical protein
MSDEQESGVDLDASPDEVLARYFPEDTPEADEPEEDAEVDDVSDDEGDEPEDEAEPDVSGEADEPEEQPAAPDYSELQSKELQKLQQLNATYAKQLAAYQANPTQEAAAKVEKTKSRLDAIVESGKDVDPYEASVYLAQEAKAHEAALAELQKSVADTSGMSAKQTASLQQQMARIQFKLDHPDLGDRYDELAQAAASEVDEMLGDAVKAAPPEVLARLDYAAFMRRVQAEKAKLESVEEAAPEAPPTRKKPVATNPVKTKSGKSQKPSQSLEDVERDLRRKMGLE